MRKSRVERGAEPDECYVVGPLPAKTARPDLAIEVLWTSGGLDKMEIYAGLGVRELWICRAEKKKVTTNVLALRRDRYVSVARSRVLPGVNLDLFTKGLGAETQTQAVKTLRAALRSKTKGAP